MPGNNLFYVRHFLYRTMYLLPSTSCIKWSSFVLFCSLRGWWDAWGVSSLQEVLLLISGCQDESPARVSRVLQLCGSDGLSRFETCESCGALEVLDGNGVRDQPPSPASRGAAFIQWVGFQCAHPRRLCCFPGEESLPWQSSAPCAVRRAPRELCEAQARVWAGSAQCLRGALLSVGARTGEKAQFCVSGRKPVRQDEAGGAGDCGLWWNHNVLVPAQRAQGPAVPVLRVKCQCWGEKCPKLALPKGR